MAKTYLYPAVFRPLGDGSYFISFPDIAGCITEGKDLNDAVAMARDVLSLYLLDAEEDRRAFPTPSMPSDIAHAADEFVSIIDADLDAYRKALDRRAVKKSISLPAWMYERVKKEHINLSRFVQDALQDEFGGSAN